jgi:hypothetical protein
MRQPINGHEALRHEFEQIFHERRGKKLLGLIPEDLLADLADRALAGKCMERVVFGRLLSEEVLQWMLALVAYQTGRGRDLL